MQAMEFCVRGQWLIASGEQPKAGCAISSHVIPQLQDYSYDDLNRIGSVAEQQMNSGGGWAASCSQTFAYDRYGNKRITAATGGVNGYNPTYNTANNRINGLTYDAAGNITYDALTGGTMAYDAENRLLTASSGGGASYAYDGEGKRVKRATAGQEWWYVHGIGGELLAEYLSSAPTTVKKEYGYRSGQMLVMWDADKSEDERLKWLVTDHLGSTRMEADKSGSLAAMRRHDFLPFGEELTSSIGAQRSGIGYEPPQSNIRQKFTSKERDIETSLDFFEARYYTNAQGRFTSPDPLSFWMLEEKEQDEYLSNPQRMNKYVYVLNNPLQYVDPDGLVDIPAWNKLKKSLRKDLVKRGVTKAIWNSWDNDQRQRVLNARAVLKEAGVWKHVTRITFGDLKKERNLLSANKAYFTPNQKSWFLAITTNKDIGPDLKKAGWSDRWNPNHPENKANWMEPGWGIVMHLGQLMPPSDKYSWIHWDKGGGWIFHPGHLEEVFKGTGASTDDVTKHLGQTEAAKHLKGISKDIDKLLIQPRK